MSIFEILCLVGGIAVLALLIVIIVLIGKFHSVKKELEEIKGHQINLVGQCDKRLGEIKDTVDVVLDGLLLAQMKDKLGLIELVSKKKQVKPEVVEEIKKEVKKEKESKKEKVQVVKNPYTPVD